MARYVVKAGGGRVENPAVESAESRGTWDDPGEEVQESTTLQKILRPKRRVARKKKVSSRRGK
jgi:hypothetical protein